MNYFLSLGSNLGERESNLIQALSLLKKEEIKVLKVSSLYETQPVDFPDQRWFYNQVAKVKSPIDPLPFLALLKKIEQKMGRQTLIYKGPRIIDIDILLAENIIIQTEKLKIPHPRMDKRNFILLPLAEIAPNAVHPLLKETIKDLLKKSGDRSIVIKLRRKN